MSNNSIKRILVFITEGPTDQEFYKKINVHIKEIHGNKKFNFDEIMYICAEGIGNMHRKMLGKFKHLVSGNDKFCNYAKIVCFCYDLDVFKNNINNPPINRERMKKDFYDAGADKIIEIIADDCIENFFTKDIEGIKKFLNLGKRYKVPNKKGLELIKQMFKDGKKIYHKGTRVEGLVDSLNINLILAQICPQVSKLCDEFGYNCQRNMCKTE